MTTCPGTYPTVLNGQIFYNDTNTAEFECLSGFHMTGTKRITCTAGVWETAPTCSVIRQYDEVDFFPDWWLLVLAILLGLIVLACFICLFCYFCCCRADNAVYPYRHGHTAVCCGRSCSAACCGCCSDSRRRTAAVEDGEETHDGVYFVPVHHTQGKYFVVSPASKNRATSTDSDDGGKGSKTTGDADDKKRRTRTKNTGTNTDDSGDTGHPKVSYLYSGYGGGGGGAGSNSLSNGNPRSSDSYGWGTTRSERGDAKGSYPKAWKDSSNFETRSDGDLNERPYKAVKKPAKEVRAWLPHANRVRNNNTSTK